MSALQQILVAEAGVAGPAYTYATWNPSFANTGVTLSGGDLTAKIGSNAGLVRSTIGKTSGKWYWECVVDISVTAMLPGICDGTEAKTSWPGSTTTSASYKANGDILSNNIALYSRASYTTGDVIGFALNKDANQISLYKNNALQVTVSISSATWYACAGAQSTSSTGTITANFGATPLTYFPPAGFNAGLYT